MSIKDMVRAHVGKDARENVNDGQADASAQADAPGAATAAQGEAAGAATAAPDAATTTVLLVGVGGQGTVLAGDVLARVALASGFDVKLSEIHGMSQRGGSVSTVVRFGREVASMVADPGSADLVVSFDKLEALRAQGFLARDGAVLFTNDELQAPQAVACGKQRLPRDIDGRLDKLGARRIPAAQLAQEAGSPKSVNIALLGAASTVLPFTEEVWRAVIEARVPKKTVEANLAAFAGGRKHASCGAFPS